MSGQGARRALTPPFLAVVGAVLMAYGLIRYPSEREWALLTRTSVWALVFAGVAGVGLIVSWRIGRSGLDAMPEPVGQPVGMPSPPPIGSGLSTMLIGGIVLAVAGAAAGVYGAWKAPADQRDCRTFGVATDFLGGVDLDEEACRDAADDGRLVEYAGLAVAVGGAGIAVVGSRRPTPAVPPGG